MSASGSVAAVAPAAVATASAAASIVPAPGISHMAKLLFITTKLHSRNLISKEERKILKQLALRNDPSLLQVDLQSPTFLTSLIDLASSIAVTAAASTFHNFLFNDCSTNAGKTMSKAERKEKQISDNSFVYGEIDFHSFAQIVKEIRPLFKPDGVFVDLGSGTGRACFAMALLSDVRRIVGIEALSSLVGASRAVLEKFETFVESDEVEVEVEPEEGEEEEAGVQNGEQQGGVGGSPARPKRVMKVLHSPLQKLERRASLQEQSRISFIESDFLQIDWSNADCVFLNSTCYSPSLMQSISEQAERLRPGAIVVSLTKALTSPRFAILSKQKKQMSWGISTVFVQRRQGEGDEKREEESEKAAQA